MESKNYTIKDIAKLAGVSAGTVDRVLHNRGDVSMASMEKVKKVLDEIDYHPNMFAIGLAAKKKYRIICVIPYYIENDYWHTVVRGIERASEELRPFNVTINFVQYRHTDRLSYEQACKSVWLMEERPDAVLIAPNFREETVKLTAHLGGLSIPYVFIDHNIMQTRPLCYIGQDSERSGHIAAQMLLTLWEPGQEIAIFQHNLKDNPAEIQMQRRLEGFMQYIRERKMDVTIHDVVLEKEDMTENYIILKQFFTAHPNVALGVVFNSKVYQVAQYLYDSGHRLERLIGYDILPRNVSYLKLGTITHLLGQRPGLQGYLGLKALADKVVFKRPVTAVKYMPIDILLKDNIEFYFEIE